MYRPREPAAELRRILVQLLQNEGRREDCGAIQLTTSKQMRFRKHKIIGCGTGAVSGDETLEFLHAFGGTIHAGQCIASFFISRFQRRRFQAENLCSTLLPPHPPMGRLQHFAKVLGVDFIQPAQAYVLVLRRI